jgi:hypothetical protein
MARDCPAQSPILFRNDGAKKAADKIMYRAKARKIKIRDFRDGVGPQAVVMLTK